MLSTRGKNNDLKCSVIRLALHINKLKQYTLQKQLLKEAWTKLFNIVLFGRGTENTLNDH